jgi:hypothetical protein
MSKAIHCYNCRLLVDSIQVVISYGCGGEELNWCQKCNKKLEDEYLKWLKTKKNKKIN